MDSALAIPRPISARRRWAVYGFVMLALFLIRFVPADVDPALRDAIVSGDTATMIEVVDTTSDKSQSGSRPRQLTFIALGALGLLGVARRGGAALRPRQPLAALALLYAATMAASVLWAEVPAISFRRWAALALVFAAIAGALRQLDGEHVVELTILAAGTWLGVGLLVELGNGTLRPFSANYRFFGLFHANLTGQLCALLVLAALSLPVDRWRPGLRNGLVAAGLVLLVLTKSRSAAAGAVVALGARWLLTARPSRALTAVIVALWLGCFAALAGGDDAGAAAERAVLMGRAGGADAKSLSGRIPLWEELLHEVAERPLLGHGFGSYWTAENVERISRTQGWAISHAHSLYVDLLLEFGALGLGLFVPMVVVAIVEAARRYRGTRDGAHGFAVGVLVFMLVAGALEPTVAAQTLPSALFYWTVAFLAFRAPASRSVPA
jgi:O-antigen ligase